jgi:hypothetical protein
LIESSLHFVRVKPVTFLLEEMFEKFNEGRNKERINKTEFKELMEFIFSSYNWPRKTGEPRKKIATFNHLRI